MIRNGWFCFLCLCLLAPVWARPDLGPLPTEAYQAPHSVIHGASLGEWSSRWWQWAYLFPNDHGPIADITGEQAGLGQERSEPVWFLAGSYRTEPVLRRCKIPAGRWIFFPLINYSLGLSEEVPKKGFLEFFRRLWHDLRQGHKDACETASSTLKEYMDGATDLRMELDGQLLPGPETHRELSPQCFKIVHSRGLTYAADGYWVMLNPLQPGIHHLSFGGHSRSGFSQDISYELTVD